MNEKHSKLDQATHKLLQQLPQESAPDALVEQVLLGLEKREQKRDWRSFRAVILLAFLSLSLFITVASILSTGSDGATTSAFHHELQRVVTLVQTPVFTLSGLIIFAAGILMLLERWLVRYS